MALNHDPPCYVRETQQIGITSTYYKVAGSDIKCVRIDRDKDGGLIAVAELLFWPFAVMPKNW